MLKISGKHTSIRKNQVAIELIQKINERYTDIEGQAYIGYPIYVDKYLNNNIAVDLALITKKGVFITNIIEDKIIGYDLLQDEMYVKVEGKFKNCKFLIEKRDLPFEINIITYSLVDIDSIDA